MHSIPADQLLNRDITRLVTNILNSVGRAGSERTGTYLERGSASFTDLFRLLNDLWRQQRGNYGLCNGPIEPGEENALLRMSVDRIDSSNKSYVAGNVHVTHVGCNLAKSAASMEVWSEFLDIVRSTDDGDDP